MRQKMTSSPWFSPIRFAVETVTKTQNKLIQYFYHKGMSRVTEIDLIGLNKGA